MVPCPSVAVHRRRCKRTHPSSAVLVFFAAILHLSSSCCYCYAFQIQNQVASSHHVINCKRRRPHRLYSNMAKHDREEEEDGSILGASLLFAGTGKFYFFISYNISIFISFLSTLYNISHDFNFIHQLLEQV